MTTRRVLSARRAALDSLSWSPSAAPPAAALRDLIEAIAGDYCDGDRADAVLSLLDDHDAQFSDLLLFATGINLTSTVDPEPDAGQALVDHIARLGTSFAIGDPDVPVALARLVTLTALARHAGDRRAAMRAGQRLRRGVLRVARRGHAGRAVKVPSRRRTHGADLPMPSRARARRRVHSPE